jgi:membrane protein implicated in regulation of membrane protease activity
MWQMTPAYKLWVFGGLAVIVRMMVALGLANPTGEGLIFVALPMLAVFLARGPERR